MSNAEAHALLRSEKGVRSELKNIERQLSKAGFGLSGRKKTYLYNRFDLLTEKIKVIDSVRESTSL